MTETHATDPGAETVDLSDELALTDTEATSWLDVPTTVVTPDLARLVGAVDYEWCTWLADELRAAGCSVVEHPGWKTRGRPRTAGPHTPRGLMWHHDGSPKGPSPALARFIAEVGRPSDGIPAPLAQLWVCAGCHGEHPVGTWHVLAAGRANHAGVGEGWGRVGRDLGNTLTLGVETDNTTGEATPAVMYDSLVKGSAAILRRLGSDPDQWLTAHKEYAAGRKSDPDDIDMDEARRDVADVLTRKRKSVKFVPYPGAKHFQIGHKCARGHVRRLEQWLLTLEPASKHKPSRVYTAWTKNAVTRAERRLKIKTNGDGVPNARAWRRIQLAAKAAR